MISDRYAINKIKISRLNLDRFLNIIEEAVKNMTTGYICVTNSRTAYYANWNPEYCRIQNESMLTVPDGTPLVWIAHNLGYTDVGRVCGPDIFSALLDASKTKGYSHFFYGSTPSVISKMNEKIRNHYPEMDLKGAVSPPFQPVECIDIDALAYEINKLRPTFFWCGLGAPKQENLMSLLQPKLDATICIGVGLAFEYFAGTVIRAPKWIQKVGLEWLIRIIQQPKKNLKRMIPPFTWISLKLLKSFILKRV